MNNKPSGEWSEGRFVRPPGDRSFPANETDCSRWQSDIPDSEWSVGHFRPLTVSVPPMSWLEFTVEFQVDANLKAVERAVSAFVDQVSALEPALSLRYDASRSRVAEDGDLIVALVPQNPDEAKLAALGDKVAQLSYVKKFEKVGAR